MKKKEPPKIQQPLGKKPKEYNPPKSQTEWGSVASKQGSQNDFDQICRGAVGSPRSVYLYSDTFFRVLVSSVICF